MIMTNKYRFKKLCAVSLALILTFSVFGRLGGENAVTGSADQTKDRYEAQLNELREQQAQIDAQLADADKQIESENDNLDAINKKYKNLRLKIENVEKQTAELEDQMVELDSQLRDARAELEIMNDEIDVGRDVFMERIRSMYVAGGTVSYENVLINSADFYDVLMRMELVKRVAAYDDEALDDLMSKKRKIEQTEQEIQEKSDKLKTKAQDYAETQAELLEKQDELAKLIIESGDKITALENDKDELQKKYKELSDDYDKIFSLAQTTTTTTKTTTIVKTGDDDNKTTTTVKKTGDDSGTAKTTTKRTGDNSVEEKPVSVDTSSVETTTPKVVEEIKPATEEVTDPVGDTPDVDEPDPAPVDTSRDEKIQIVVDYAKSNVGGAYVWAGESFRATDCSGLMLLSYRQIGVSLPHLAAAQANYGTSVSYADIQPGDLIFFGHDIGHVGMYIGNGRMVHAANTTDGIIISDLDNYIKYSYVYAIKRII